MNTNNRKELALYVINFKIADSIKNNKEKNFEIFNKKIQELNDEKNEIYNNNEEIIEKELKNYLEEFKQK